MTVDRYFKIRIDDRSYNVDDPKLTGSQLLRLSGKRPIDEYLVFLKLANGGFEEIRLDETVDLTQPGVERFMTFESSASYRLVIDGERIEWGAQLITGLKLKQIAGVDPDKYALWREVRGSEDIELANEDIIDLSEPGLERFFTVIAQTTAGDAGPALPQGDQRYLSEQGYRYELAYEAGQTAIILRAVDLPKGRYDVELADILIMLPPGYPDAPPDMFLFALASACRTRRLPQLRRCSAPFRGRPGKGGRAITANGALLGHLDHLRGLNMHWRRPVMRDIIIPNRLGTAIQPAAFNSGEEAARGCFSGVR